MLLELRSTGMQTVVPPSTHESGEPISWETEGAAPAGVAPDELLSAVAALANAVKVELGEKAAPKPHKPPKPCKPPASKCLPGSPPSGALATSDVPVGGTDARARCLAAMLRMKMAAEQLHLLEVDADHWKFGCTSA